jgi:tRNA (guanine-N7-)-methyltransferase
VTTGQLKARQEIGGAYVIEYAPQALNISAIFPEHSNETPLVFEIGFGMGEATASIAQTLSNTNFICCEVHDPGVGALLKRIGENDIKNIRIIQHDAVEVLEHMIQHLCLDGIHIFFPDPWHKKKHNKRRLVQSEFIKSIVPKLKVGGYIHCATDWEAYAVQMLEVLSNEKTLSNTSTESSGYAIKPEYRPLTKFENRGLKLGHGVWDLVFKKN